ncbi:unnamed protein product, partial [Choristocarpus tenellus]
MNGRIVWGGRVTTAAVALAASWVGAWTPLRTISSTTRRSLADSSFGKVVLTPHVIEGRGEEGRGSGRRNRRSLSTQPSPYCDEGLSVTFQKDSTNCATSNTGLRVQVGSPRHTAESRAARIVPAEEPWLSEAGSSLRRGNMVAFPTETVYGLGANALSEEAVLNIFKAKRRPLTDPLIVHVPDAASAMSVLDFEGEEGGGEEARLLFAHLGSKLWPGPLTLILKAAPGLPECVTAATGFVGVRCPAHPVAHQLLLLAGVPVAA